MLTQHEKIKIINILNSILGSGTKKKDDNYAYYCPFCHHHKKKLEIDIESQSWHCWVCDAKGKKIHSLLRKLNVDTKTLNQVNTIYGNDYIYSENTSEPEIELRLPAEFISLTKIPTGFNPLYKKVIHYLTTRKLTPYDIVRYNIGYCKGGMYNGRIIIPSYDDNGKLNYFIARTVFENELYSYRNPPVSKDIVALANQINWNEPITLCEGIFDAMAIKRNVIPLFGKIISKSLMELIFEKSVTDINIMLDRDAQKQALYYTNYFIEQGIRTKNIIPKEKDASEMGFSEATKVIRNTDFTNYTDIIFQKLNL